MEGTPTADHIQANGHAAANLITSFTSGIAPNAPVPNFTQ